MVWYDPDVNRLNYDEHGRLLGEFSDTDKILVILKNGDYYLTNFEVNNWNGKSKDSLVETGTNEVSIKVDGAVEVSVSFKASA